MNTFLPFVDFVKSAAVLDDKRLYKQIVECKQILNTLSLKRGREAHAQCRQDACPDTKRLKRIAWENHPAVLMWEGHDIELRGFQTCCIREWAIRRWGINYTDWKDLNYPNADELQPSSITWLGDESFHRAMRSNLKRKDPQHYTPLFEPDLPDNLEYVWPVQKQKVNA